MRANAVLIGLFSMTCAAACSPGGEGRFTVGTVHAHEECFAAAFPFEPYFLAARERTESVGIFMQSRGGSFQFVDVISFEVFEPDATDTAVPYALDVVATQDSHIVAALELGESCPGLDDSLSLEGTVEFTQWSREIDGVIAGRVDAAVRSLRSGELVAEQLQGNFEFTIQVGQPYEEFRN